MEAVLDLVKPPEAAGLGPTSVSKENENVDDCDDATRANGATQHPQEAAQAQNPSPLVEEPPVLLPDTTTAKKPTATKATSDVSKKTNKTQKSEVGGRNGLATNQHKQRPRVSQSISFPASKGILTSDLRKSTTDAKVTKAAAPRTSRSNGGPVLQSSLANGASAKQTKFASVPATRQSTIVKSSAPSDANDGGSSSSMLPTHGNIKPPKTDEDAESTTSSTTPCAIAQQKSSTPIFASRLDERAEKRKEFFLKLEEKIQAKEMEKTDQQAKSKEDQEAEIKKLRKSLTFKATPMPSFYKEPGPPKTELKKQIPTTRPVSPKLGRHKPPATVTYAPQGNGLRSYLDTTKSNGDATSVAEGSVEHKKTVRKSLSKLPSLKSTSSKLGKKSPGIKAKVSDPEENDEKAKEVVEINTKHMEEPLIETKGTDQDPVANAVEKDQSALDSPVAEIAPEEVSVRGRKW